MHGLRGVSHYRSVFLSDIHLGTRGCKADLLIDFLKHTDCRYLYLVGDIVDGWRLRRNWFWQACAETFLSHLVSIEEAKKAASPTREQSLMSEHG